jgi:LemA protein
MTPTQWRAAHPDLFFLDPTRPVDLARWLAGTGLLQPGEVVLQAAKAGDGNMNCTLRVTTSRRSLIVKQSRPWVEKYPQLKSQEGYLKLQDQLEGQENRVRITLRDYNEAVRGYNTTIRTFPDIIGAKIIHGAKPMVPYQATTQGAETAPTLDMAPAT